LATYQWWDRWWPIKPIGSTAGRLVIPLGLRGLKPLQLHEDLLIVLPGEFLNELDDGALSEVNVQFAYKAKYQ
jgi:hypothetical protein